MGPRGYETVPRGLEKIRQREETATEILRLETAAGDAARRIGHIEERLADPRWAKSVDLQAQLSRAHKRLEEANNKLKEARSGPLVRPVHAGTAAEVAEEQRAENAAVVTFDSKPLSTTDWMEIERKRNGHAARKAIADELGELRKTVRELKEPAGKEQDE